MPQEDMNSEKGRALIEVGKVGIGKGDEYALDAYFNKEDYVIHLPYGDLGYPPLKAFFASMREALDEYNCTRHDLLVKGDLIAARTLMSGHFVRPLESTPYGTIPPNGASIKLELINFFRYDAEGKLVEEWVQGDFLGFYNQLGVDLVPRKTLQ